MTDKRVLDDQASEELALEARLRRRRIKQKYLIAVSVLYILVTTVFGTVTAGFKGIPTGANVLFYFLLNLNILALFWLIYFVVKNLVRLMLERKRGVIGTRFKAKVVGIFFVLIAIPIIVLFVVATQLGANYIDRFFTPQFRKPVESSLEVAKSVYNLERDRTMRMAEFALEGNEMPPGYSSVMLMELPVDASTAVHSAFKGEPFVEVMSDAEGDRVRAAVPMDMEGMPRRVLVVETTIPSNVTEDIKHISEAYESYLQLEAYNVPLKLNYLMILGFFTLIIIFTSIWVAIRVATWMTEPVKILAQATEEVADGNLTVEVETQSTDEIGMLIRSFNHMVRQIREGKESLEHAYVNLNNIVRSIQSGVVSLDTRGRVQLINEAACELLGVSADDVIDKPSFSIMKSMESQELVSIIRSVNKKGFKKLERELWVNINKRMGHLRVLVSAIKGPRGGALGFLVVFDDITDLIKAQRAIAWQEVARRITHEIKNPLTPILLNTERMLKKWQRKDEDFDKIFERSSRAIIEEVQGLKSLVNEFSKLGRMPEIKRQPSDVMKIINSAKALYGSVAGVEVKVKAQEDLPEVLLDSEQIKRVLVNLLNNAIVALDRRGTVVISAHASLDANRLVLEVADDGPGIPDDQKEKLFAPYFSTKKKDGSGLGLAIADRIISEHGGSISVGDNAPKGSVFTVTLPIVPA